ALGQLSTHVRQLESRSGRPKSGYASAAVSALKLQIPELKAGKVHQRLYLEFYDRQERKRALQESVQQARENEVLDIFKSQHPWLNALAKQSEVFSFLSAYTEGLNEEQLIEASELWRSHAEVEAAWRAQLEKRFTRPSPPQRQVPSPRSPASPQADSPVAVPSSPHLAANYYPLIISRLAGETTPAGPSSERQSPSSSSRTGLSGKLQRPKSSG
ncbi:RABA2A, partial [Symbiodinium sp. CCMP2456]